MNRLGYCFSILLLLVLMGHPCHAAKLKAYVNKFSVSVPENREELKTGLQTLLMSRLNSEEIQAVDNQSEADVQISGSYIVFGNIFSLDALIKTNSGAFIDRVFVQGDTQNELIPTVAQIAYQLQRALMKWNPALTTKALVVPSPYPTAKAPLVAVQKAVPPENRPAATPKRPEVETPPEKPWVSQRLPEALNGIASSSASTGETEIFVTGEHSLGYYRKGESLQFLAETVFESNEIVYGVDAADLDRNGTAEVYVSIMKAGLPASRVYVPENNTLKRIGADLPYLLRGIAFDGKAKKIYAQKVAADGSFTGDVYELAKSGEKFSVANPLQLPLFGDLYNFNRFSTAKGKGLFVVAHPEGYLLVYSKDRKQLWKSREKFGGKETFECTRASADANAPLHAATACSLTPAQRLLVTKSGDIIVSRNTGLTVSGAMRNYSINTVVQLSWDGTTLQDKRRSEQSRNYLADFSYEERNKELLLLEVDPKGDTPRERGSRLVVKKLVD